METYRAIERRRFSNRGNFFAGIKTAARKALKSALSQFGSFQAGFVPRAAEALLILGTFEAQETTAARGGGARGRGSVGRGF